MTGKMSGERRLVLGLCLEYLVHGQHVQLGLSLHMREEPATNTHSQFPNKRSGAELQW